MYYFSVTIVEHYTKPNDLCVENIVDSILSHKNTVIYRIPKQMN